MKIDDFLQDLELNIDACKSNMGTRQYQRLDQYRSELRQSYNRLVTLLKRDCSYGAAFYSYLLQVSDLPYTDENYPKTCGEKDLQVFYTDYIQLGGEVVAAINEFKGIYEALIQEFQFPSTLLERVLFNLKNWIILWINYISSLRYFSLPYLPCGSAFPSTYAFQMEEGYNVPSLREIVFYIYQRNNGFLQLLERLLSQAKKKTAMRKDGILPFFQLNKELKDLRSEKPWVMPGFVITAFCKLQDRALFLIELGEKQGIEYPDAFFIRIKEVCLELKGLLNQYVSAQYSFPVEEVDVHALSQEIIDQFCHRLPGTLSLERYIILHNESNLNELSEDSKVSIFSQAQSMMRTTSQLVEKNPDSLSQILIRAIIDLQDRFMVKLSLMEIPGAISFFTKLIEQNKELTQMLNKIEIDAQKRTFTSKFFTKPIKSKEGDISCLERDFIYWKQSLPLASLREKNFFPFFDYQSKTNFHEICGLPEFSTDRSTTTTDSFFPYPTPETSDTSSLSSSSSSYVF